MGAQTVERKHKFIQRYNEVEKSEGEYFRRLTDSKGLSPLRPLGLLVNPLEKITQNLSRDVAKGSTMQEDPLGSGYKLVEDSRRNDSCKHCLMCLMLLHSVLFPWVGRDTTAKSNVP